MKSYKITQDGVFCAKSFEKIEELNIDISKFFINDSFDENGEIIISPTRENKYIAGVLDLRNTFGKEKKKFIYLCRPDDKRLPPFYISYEIPYSFEKNVKMYYITFQFKHWDLNYPMGTITQNIGDVNHLPNYYEYVLYCKSLNVSIQSFTKDSIKQTKQYQPINDIPFRNARLFTIDSNDSIDLDDGLSIDDEKVSIYITHVPYILDKLNLWESFTNRISTIYLPDKKRPMLPCILAQLCSLNEGNDRVCFILDLYHTGEINFSIEKVHIYKNFSYNSEELKQFPDYLKLLELSETKSSYELITKYMILFNTKCAEFIKKGIHKTTYKPDNIPHNILPAYYQQYSKYEYQGNYLQITSPIRRLIDILNMYQLTVEMNLLTMSNNSKNFHDNWYQQIDYMNTTMKHVRSVQNKCKLLSIFDKEKHKQFTGYVFDKIIRSDGRYKYNVYIPQLELSTTFTHSENMQEYSEHSFTIYVFHDEVMFKKKVKLQLYKD
jgi:exoribonuclease R